MPIVNILFDRDGTLIHDCHYLSDPKHICLLPGVGEALAQLSNAGIRLFIVTNQSGIGRGYFSQADYIACEQQLNALLAEHGVFLTDSMHCPHTPDDACPCRKPSIGLWKTLQERYALKAEETIMVGDKMADVFFGHQAGCIASVLVLTGKGTGVAEKYNLVRGTQSIAYAETTVPLTVFADVPSFVEQLLQNRVGNAAETEIASKALLPYGTMQDTPRAHEGMSSISVLGFQRKEKKGIQEAQNSLNVYSKGKTSLNIVSDTSSKKEHHND